MPVNKPCLTPASKLLGGIAIFSLSVLAASVQAQINDSIRGEPSEANHFIATPEGWEHPMTPWGEPDIGAMLDMMQASRVPLERCANAYRSYPIPECDLDKAWLTEEEFNANMEAWLNSVDRSMELAEQGDYGAAIQAGVTDPNRPQRQLNLIVKPDNGLLPELTAEAKRRALEMKSDWPLPAEEPVFEGAGDFDSWDRCITRGMPSSMMPYRYNGGFAIRQGPGVVVFDLEMIHDARVIPTDGSAHVDPEIKQWMGESRAYWEGTTLVVETSNYKVGPPMINLAVVGSPPGNRFPISEQMKTTERLVRLNDEWFLYEITTEDPVILSEPFTVRYPMHHDPEYWWSEYACHEDNTIVQNFTETSRYARENPTPEPPQPAITVDAEVASTLAGKWSGQPVIATIDYDIELEFIRNDDGTINANLIGTTFGDINQPLRSLTIDGRLMNFTFPNITPWNFSGEIMPDGSIVGVLTSIQGGVPVTFVPAEE